MNREGERERGIDGKVTGRYLFTGYGRDTQLRMPRKGPSHRRSYPVAYLRVCENCNGLLPDRRIVVACFKTLKIVMAWNQKTPE
jgi:hypothetical protein